MKEELVLEFHRWRKMRPDDDNELIAIFCFSLMPAGWREAGEAGERPSHEDVFWTEVKLAHRLAEAPGWQKISPTDKIKAMFQHAVEQIRAAGRKLRQAPMVWTPTSDLRNGPPWELRAIRFPKAPPVTFSREEPAESPRFLARKAAGLVK